MIGHDGVRRSCQRGLPRTCVNAQVNGVSMDGGYAEYMILREEAAIRRPPELDPVEIAPLVCAGVTLFNSMRQMRVLQGGLVAVQGLGGLGRLAVQFANKMGYEVVALSSAGDKEGLRNASRHASLCRHNKRRPGKGPSETRWGGHDRIDSIEPQEYGSSCGRCRTVGQACRARANGAY